jgi:hypothetical protein
MVQTKKSFGSFPHYKGQKNRERKSDGYSHERFGARFFRRS